MISGVQAGQPVIMQDRALELRQQVEADSCRTGVICLRSSRPGNSSVHNPVNCGHRSAVLPAEQPIQRR